MSEMEKNEDMLEVTTEIKQGHAKIGKLNVAIEIILTIVCVAYLVTHMTAP